jgi:hypothetical protein
MKSAVCISGLSRTYKQTFSNFKKNVLQPLKELGDCDIFISIWSTKEINQINPNYSSFEDPSDINDIISKYRPKNIEIESFKEIKDNFLLSNWTNKKCPVNNVVKNDVLMAAPASYKVMRCNQLKQNYEKLKNFKYDLVLRTRFDVEIDQIRPNEFDLSKINCLYSYDNLIGDYFYISNSENDDKISQLFNNYSTLLNIKDTDMGPERNLAFHCQSHKIEPHILKNYSFSLVRECYKQDYKV